MLFQRENIDDNDNDTQNLLNKPRSKMSIRASSLSEILRLEGSTSAEKVKEFVKTLKQEVPVQESDTKKFLKKLTYMLGQSRSILCGFCLFFLVDRIFMFYINGGMKNIIALNILGIIGAIFVLLLLLILNK